MWHNRYITGVLHGVVLVPLTVAGVALAGPVLKHDLPTSSTTGSSSATISTPVPPAHSHAHRAATRTSSRSPRSLTKWSRLERTRRDQPPSTIQAMASARHRRCAQQREVVALSVPRPSSAGAGAALRPPLSRPPRQEEAACPPSPVRANRSRLVSRDLSRPALAGYCRFAWKAGVRARLSWTRSRCCSTERVRRSRLAKRGGEQILDFRPRKRREWAPRQRPRSGLTEGATRKAGSYSFPQPRLRSVDVLAVVGAHCTGR
jgi:hypothetical protein